ncbi:hypothetical protein FS837_012667 [Tulasnella sp. UAMH 9824]|nr:hypothetical protein FS837_012667 [Tulasnella sp. UAMH 9824]
MPTLAKALIPRGTWYGSPSFKDFSQLLDKLQSKSRKAKRSAAAILTRPPEIFAILAVQVPADKARSTPSTTVFAIFDSHSRPGRHAQGAAITFFGTSTGAATYLEELLTVDEALTSTSQLDWQTDLLSQFSAHFLVASETEHSMTLREAELELFQASIRTLELQAELDGMKSTMEDLREKYNREKAERGRAEDELAVVRAELRSVREGAARREAEIKPLATPPSSKGKEKAFETDDEIEYDDVYSTGFEIPGGGWYESHPAKSPVVRLNERHATQDHSTTAPKGAAFNEDIALAMKLQQQFLEEDRVLHAQFFQLQATSQQTFDCGICMDTHPEDMVAIVSGCSHDFCRECLTNHVKATLERMKFPVFCPVCSTKQTKTGAYKGGVLTQQNVQMLGVSEEDYERWIEFELASHSVLIECQK